MISVDVRAWGAWAPGLEATAAWRRWARGNEQIRGDYEPKARSLPADIRRRLGRLGRMAFEAIHACPGVEKGTGVVFCSRYGEMGRTAELLIELAREGRVAPASFSVSVHNALAGLYSMAMSDNAPTVAVSAGQASAAQGVIEAVGYLSGGAREVLLVVYDEPLPDVYKPFADESEIPYAWAWRLATSTTTGFSLSWEPAPNTIAAAPVPDEPFGLKVMRFLLSGAPEAVMAADGRTWRWQRNR